MRLRPLLLLSCAAAASLLGCVPSYQVAGGGSDAGTPDTGTGAADAGIDASDASAGDTGAADTGAADTGVDGGGLSETVFIPSGTFTMQPGASPTQATLTHNFKIDRYEVTVARFRVWVNKSFPLPCGGGACDLEPTGPYAGVMRWDPSWNALVTADAFRNSANCGDALGTSYNTPTYVSATDTLPVSCVSWYQALAFCASIGRRLPTETEWEYVATSRANQRTYPWGSTAPDCTLAIWNQGTQNCGWPVPAGSATLGGSVDHVMDLSGSLYEWVWDFQGGLPATTTDYPGPDAGTNRGTRGGSFASAMDKLRAASRDETPPTGTYADIGFRCASSL